MDASDRKKRAAAEAADWFSRLQAGGMEHSEREVFVEWLRESHLHIAEMLRIAQIHGSLERFDRWSLVSTGTKTSADEVAQVSLLPNAVGHSTQTPQPARTAPVTAPKTKLGASLMALTAMVLLVVGTLYVVPRLRGQIIETDRGERREVALADGSVLLIDPQTRLRVQYADAVRQVFLARGRAVFRVAKNSTRPFLVQVGDTTIQAVGTAFGVEQRAQGIVVTVAEGKVSVSAPINRPPLASRRELHQRSLPAISSRSEESSRPLKRADESNPGTVNGTGSAVGGISQGQRFAGSDFAADRRGSTAAASSISSRELSRAPERSDAGQVFLTANQQLMVRAGGFVEPMRQVDSARALAWADGRLIFQNDEVGQAVAEFNRYSHVQMTVTDPVLARKPVSGVFNAAEPETFIAFLQSVTSVEIIRNADGSITIRSAQRR
jgi:ferric-dicitrate binding protein FerR (iron transport regulator)